MNNNIHTYLYLVNLKCNINTKLIGRIKLLITIFI